MKYCFKICLNKLLIGYFIFKILNRKSVVKILRFIIARYILRKKIPALAILALTYKCQCHCVHCSAGLYQTSSEELKVEEWKKVIDELDELEVPRIHISGGEPTLKKGINEIVRYAVSKGMVTFLETNGYSLNQQLLRYLKKAGVASIDISLDSADAYTHDRLRGLEKSFEKAIQGIKLCRICKIPCMISTYATRNSIYSDDLIKLIILAKKMKASAIRIMPPQPSGRWLSNFKECLKEEDKIYLRKKFPIYAILDRTELPYCPIRTKYTVFVGPDGEIHPCPHLPFSFGNVRSIGIDEALEKMSKNAMFEKRSICYINEAGFRDKFIKPILANNKKLPMRV